MKIEIKNKKLSYEIKGEGPVIIFVHSYLWDKNMWRPQIEELSKNYKCIAIDLWGHGNSDSLEDMEVYSLEELSHDIILLADALKINKFNYIGLSVGGMIGANLAINYSDRLSSCVIMDSYSGIEPLETKNIYFGMLGMIEKLKKIPDELKDKIAPMFFTKNESLTQGKLYTSFKKSLGNISENNIQTVVALGRGIFGRISLLEKLIMIKTPTCFIVGDEDIPRPFKESQEMSILVENSLLYCVKNAGHISNLENPIEITKILLEFLNKNSK